MGTTSPWLPLRLKSGAELPNRFVLAPMTTDSAEPGGTVSEAELRYLERRCANPFAMTITSCAYVADDGRSWQGIGAADEAHVDSLRAVAAAMRGGGGLPVLQLYDGGRIADPGLVGGERLRAPSAVPSLRPGALTPRELAGPEVSGLLGRFVDAARRGERAGFAGIELHGANHYLIHQFFSPRANRRDDRWGGDRERRMRFPLELTAAVRAALGPRTVLGFRVNPYESEPGGFTLGDAAELSSRLAGTGVDYVHISMDDFRRRSPQREDRDWTTGGGAVREERNPITAIAAAVAGRCAVIASGGVRSADDARAALAAGADLVAVGRAVVIDPEWLGTVRDGGGRPPRSRLPADRDEIESALTLPSRMVTYLLSRPNWVPRESTGREPTGRETGGQRINQRKEEAV
ncbi:alpha-hydroxy-acid oxidizing protein [Actinomadura chibensis]|uniref:Flavin oxidoreductase n=1 Tax=Actinomadura chibensis TaxID=392828 RepID=A0A5D0N9S7_9ACTN|nr:alpha-hydroxy-acid oxidizing protein [Actinomadura chibensis]TYB41069.1 flavin oxidoreductase [Actinomadura chibensis]